MYPTYNERKSVVPERIIRTLKSKLFKHMTAVSKSVYFDVFYFDTITQFTIKMKPIGVTPDSYIEYNKDSDEKDPKFKVGDHVRISRYKDIFAKGYTQSWSEEVFVISKIKNTVPWTHIISDLNGEPITGTFYEKELQKLVRKNTE